MHYIKYIYNISKVTGACFATFRIVLAATIHNTVSIRDPVLYDADPKWWLDVRPQIEELIRLTLKYKFYVCIIFHVLRYMLHYRNHILTNFISYSNAHNTDDDSCQHQ